MTEPIALADRWPALPDEIKQSGRCVLWNLEARAEHAKPTKVPYVPSRHQEKASSTDAATWDTFSVARDAVLDGDADGVGFVLGDGYAGVDLDGCRDPETGVITDEALAIIDALDSYTEISPSGTGVHVLVRGTLPDGRRRKGPVEMYCAGRYFTLTGVRLDGTPTTINERTEALAALHAETFGQTDEPAQTPVGAPQCSLDDAVLLEKARSATNGAKFSRLFSGGWQADYTSQSEADQALCNLLAFWTNRDAVRIDGLFRGSGLMRQKWDTRRGDSTYGQQTIAHAIAGCPEGYTGCGTAILHDISQRQTGAQTDRRDIARQIVLTKASSIEIKPIRYLWEFGVSLGSFGLLGGREGIGKTILITTIAAQITRGSLPGVYFGSPRAVIIAATEDSWAHTVVPRLMAAGADLDLVYRVDVTTPGGSEGALSLPRDLVELARVIEDVGAVLVLLDPLLSRLDAQIDSHKDAEVRQALEPLAKLAADTNVCVLGLIHVNKSTSGDPLTMLMASRAFAAVARFVLFAMTDPDDENRRLLGLAKNNLGRSDLPTKAYRIEGHLAGSTAEGDVWTGRLEWLGDTDRTIRDAIATSADPTDKTARAEAQEWLVDYLTAEGGSADSAQVKKAGRHAGHSDSAIRRAREKLHLRTVNTDTTPRRTIWLLPVQSCHARGGTLPTDTTSTTRETSQETHTYSVVPVVSVLAPPARGDTTGDSAPATPEVPRVRL